MPEFQQSDVNYSVPNPGPFYDPAVGRRGPYGQGGSPVLESGSAIIQQLLLQALQQSGAERLMGQRVGADLELGRLSRDTQLGVADRQAASNLAVTREQGQQEQALVRAQAEIAKSILEKQTAIAGGNASLASMDALMGAAMRTMDAGYDATQLLPIQDALAHVRASLAGAYSLLQLGQLGATEEQIANTLMNDMKATEERLSLAGVVHGDGPDSPASVYAAAGAAAIRQALREGGSGGTLRVPGSTGKLVELRSEAGGNMTSKQLLETLQGLRLGGPQEGMSTAGMAGLLLESEGDGAPAAGTPGADLDAYSKFALHSKGSGQGDGAAGQLSAYAAVHGLRKLAGLVRDMAGSDEFRVNSQTLGILADRLELGAARGAAAPGYQSIKQDAYAYDLKKGLLTPDASGTPRLNREMLGSLFSTALTGTYGDASQTVAALSRAGLDPSVIQQVVGALRPQAMPDALAERVQLGKIYKQATIEAIAKSNLDPDSRSRVTASLASADMMDPAARSSLLRMMPPSSAQAFQQVFPEEVSKAYSMMPSVDPTEQLRSVQAASNAAIPSLQTKLTQAYEDYAKYQGGRQRAELAWREAMVPYQQDPSRDQAPLYAQAQQILRGLQDSSDRLPNMQAQINQELGRLSVQHGVPASLHGGLDPTGLPPTPGATRGPSPMGQPVSPPARPGMPPGQPSGPGQVPPAVSPQAASAPGAPSPKVPPQAPMGQAPNPFSLMGGAPSAVQAPSMGFAPTGPSGDAGTAGAPVNINFSFGGSQAPR